MLDPVDPLETLMILGLPMIEETACPPTTNEEIDSAKETTSVAVFRPMTPRKSNEHTSH